MEAAIGTILTSIASQGPIVAFMLWVIIRGDKTLAAKEEALKAKDDRIDDLIATIFQNNKAIHDVIIKNTEVNASMAGSFFALKEVVNASHAKN